MKTILCYGDSLTWGYDPQGPGRHALEDRWPSVLGRALSGKAQVVAEGLNGRTTAFDDFTAGIDRNGARLLPSILSTHAPLDLVIIMLGTNDMKRFLCGHAIGAAKGMRRLVEIVQTHVYPFEQAAPKVLVVSPPHAVATANADFTEVFDGAVEESARLAALYREVAAVSGAGFFDASLVAKASPIDGVHLDASNTRAIGEALAGPVKDILAL